MFDKKNLLFVCSFSLCLVLVLVVAFGSILSKAKDQTMNEPNYYKYYASIEIQPGDTLWSIADSYMDENYDSKDDYIDEVQQINSLNDSIIISGQYLIVPYYSTEYKL